MSYLREFLEYLRKRRVPSEENKNFNKTLIGAFVIASVLGVLMDIFIPFNPWVNTVRTLFALVIGASLFSFIYVMALIQAETNSKKYEYTPIRKMFSYRQRVNLSVLAFIIIGVVTLMTSGPSPVFTIKSGITIALILGVMTFMRSYRNEYISARYGMPDSRDVKFRVERDRKLSEQENKETESEDNEER